MTDLTIEEINRMISMNDRLLIDEKKLHKEINDHYLNMLEDRNSKKNKDILDLMKEMSIEEKNNFEKMKFKESVMQPITGMTISGYQQEEPIKNVLEINNWTAYDDDDDTHKFEFEHEGIKFVGLPETSLRSLYAQLKNERQCYDILMKHFTRLYLDHKKYLDRDQITFDTYVSHMSLEILEAKREIENIEQVDLDSL